MSVLPNFAVIWMLALCAQALATEVRMSAPTSSFTATSGKVCVLVSQDKETGDSTSRCPGVDGFKVLVLDSDDRASITLIDPTGKELPLNLWDVGVPGFSTLGKELEWRRVISNGKSSPIGMVLRIDTVDQSDPARPKPISFLLSARITSRTACVTGKIPLGQRDSYALARATADNPDAICLPPLAQ